MVIYFFYKVMQIFHFTFQGPCLQVKAISGEHLGSVYPSAPVLRDNDIFLVLGLLFSSHMLTGHYQMYDSGANSLYGALGISYLHDSFHLGVDFLPISLLLLNLQRKLLLYVELTYSAPGSSSRWLLTSPCHPKKVFSLS